MAYTPANYSTDCSNPKALTDYIMLAETIKLGASGQPTEAFVGCKADGTMPTATTQHSIGVVLNLRDAYATVATKGITIVKVQPGQAIALDAPVSLLAAGAKTGVIGTDEIVGRSLDVATSAGTSDKPFYVRVRLA